ncbi:hypothetical protein EDB83DRAFT_2520653 [Lactarius deliciosus]|nr:hypothetical protein EDB83DRAFT_2520653 [Lactarius deliciosus]
MPVRPDAGTGGMSTPMDVGVNVHRGFELDLPTFLTLQRRAELFIIQAAARGDGPLWDIELDHGAAMDAEDEISDNTDGDIASIRLATVLPSAVSTFPDAHPMPRDFLALALGPLSSLDPRDIEWLAVEYAGGARVSVRCGWRNLLGGLVGAAVGAPGAASSS